MKTKEQEPYLSKKNMNQKFFVFGKELVKDLIMNEFKKSVIEKMNFTNIYISNNGEIIVTWWEHGN